MPTGNTSPSSMVTRPLEYPLKKLSRIPYPCVPIDLDTPSVIYFNSILRVFMYSSNYKYIIKAIIIRCHYIEYLQIVIRSGISIIRNIIIRNAVIIII